MCVLRVYVNELFLSGASTVNEMQLVSHMSTDVSVGNSNIKQSSSPHLSTLPIGHRLSRTHVRAIRFDGRSTRPTYCVNAEAGLKFFSVNLA